MKAQMKAADRRKAEIALIIGPDELASDSIVMRLMTTGEQSSVARPSVMEAVRRSLSAMDAK